MGTPKAIDLNLEQARVGTMQAQDNTLVDVASILNTVYDSTNGLLKTSATLTSSETQYTEDAAAAANPVGTVVNLVRQDTPAGLVTTDGDNVAQRGTNYGAGFVQVVSSAGAFVDTFGGSPEASATVTGLTTSKIDAQSTTVTAVKAGSGRVYGYHIFNVNTADSFLHFYDISSGSVTVGTSARTRTLWIPAGGAIDTVFTVPLTFGTAISIAATTTITGSSAITTGLLVDIDYI